MTKAKKIFISVAVVVALLGAAAAYWVTWTGSSKEIEAVANQFKADSSWELKTNTVRPPANMCIDVRCPEVARTWLMEKPLTENEVLDILSKSGWSDVELESRDCFPEAQIDSDVFICALSGSVGAYAIQMYVSNKDSTYDKPSLVFFLSE